jgi:hypothetical protein
VTKPDDAAVGSDLDFNRTEILYEFEAVAG